MIKYLFLLLFLILLPTQSLADEQRNPCYINVSGGCTPVGTTTPMPVDATVNASINSFHQETVLAPFSATTGGVSSSAFTAGKTIVVTNIGIANMAYCQLGAGATTSSQPIAPNAGWAAFTSTSETQVTCATSTSTTTINVVVGTGLPTGVGGSIGAATNSSIGSTGAAVPAFATYIGVNSAGNLTGWNGQVTANAGTNLNTSALALEAGNLATLVSQIGAVTASPTANTVNDRLKTINTTLGSPFQASGSIGNTAFGISGTLPAFGATPTFNLGTISTAASAANQTSVIGSAGAGTAASAALLSGLIYNASPLTLTDGQQSAFQGDANGYLKVNVVAGGGSGGTSSTYGAAFPGTGTAIGFTNGTNMVAGTVDGSGFIKVNCASGCSGGTFNNNADGVATSSTNGQAAAWLYGWNGTTFDRLKTDTTNGLWVNVKASALPTGASTAAKQPALGTAGSASADVITIQGVASMTKLLVTPDSVALPANQSVNVAQVNGVTTSVNTGAVGTGTQRIAVGTDTATIAGSAPGTAGTASSNVVTVQGVASMTKLLVTPDSVALPANQSVNVAQINGVTPLMGNGATGTGSPRVTIVSDGTAISTAGYMSVKIDQTTPGTTNNVTAASATAPVSTMNSASASAGVTAANAFVFDDTSPTAITENSFGYARMSANRNQYQTIRDAGGNERGANVTSGNSLQADLTSVAGTATATSNGTVSAGVQRVAIASDNTVLPAVGAGATGVAPPANVSYNGYNSSGATGGQLKGGIMCDNHVFKHITTATDTLAVQGVASQTIYICGWRSRAAGTATWYLENTASANANCSSTLTQITGVASEVANSGEVAYNPLWGGLKNTSGNGLCINSTGTGGVDVDIWYTQF